MKEKIVNYIKTNKRDIKLKTIFLIVATILLVVGNRYTTENISKLGNSISNTYNRGEVTKIVHENKDGVVFLVKDQKSGKELKAHLDSFTMEKLKKIEIGDKVLVAPGSMVDGVQFQFYDYVRINPFIVLVVLFLVAVIIYGRSKGLGTVVALAYTMAALFFVYLPAVLARMNVYLWAAIVCVFIVSATMILVYGANKKSLSAGIGIILGLLSATLIMALSQGFMMFTGVGTEEIFFLQATLRDNPLDFQGILFSMILIGALGAVMDTAISIAASLYELKEQNPNITKNELIKSGFVIGRDIIGAMASTLILAYIGSSFISIIAMMSYENDLFVIMNREGFIFDIFQPIIGSFGILATLPLTTIICSIIYTKKDDKDIILENNKEVIEEADEVNQDNLEQKNQESIDEAVEGIIEKDLQKNTEEKPLD